MKPPIIVSESGDLSIFRSVQDAEQYLEGPDVLENLYVAYDCEGRLLRLEAKGAKNSKFLRMTTWDIGKVIITSTESEPSHVKDLEKLLRGFLEKLGTTPSSLEGATLTELLEKNVERLGSTR
jgi:hypothetical protein